MAKLKKIGLLLALLLATLAPIGTYVYNSEPTFTPAPDASDILGPQTAVVGEMVRLSVDGEEVVWRSLPENKNVQVYGDNNQNMVASFEKPGIYTIFAASTKDGTLRASLLQINVGGVAPTTPIATVPVPVDPNVPPAPVSTLPHLAGNVQAWCTEAAVDKASAKALADNFSKVASEIKLGQLKEPGAIISRTVELNKAVSQEGFDLVVGNVQAYLTSESDAGRLVTPEQHLMVWESIANGLLAYAK